MKNHFFILLIIFCAGTKLFAQQENRITLDQVQQLTARSVIGVTGNATANAAAIQGTTNQVLRVNAAGTDLAFGSVNLASSSAVTGSLAIVNGGTGATSAANARTNLGATTVGANFFTATNPSAVTFPRVNADNTVSFLDAATFRSAIGAGTGNGSVTSVAMTVPTGLSVSGTPITTSGTLAITTTLSGPVKGNGSGFTAGNINLASEVTGTLPATNGGTGLSALGTANQQLRVNAGGTALEYFTPSAGSGDISNGGNTTGAAITIGTNDAFGLNFETNNVTRASITGGASTGGLWTINAVASNTNTAATLVTYNATSSGVAANGFGVDLLFQLENSVGSTMPAGRISSTWAVATDAAERGYLDLSVAMDEGAASTVSRMLRLDGQNKKVLITPDLPNVGSAIEFDLSIATPRINASTGQSLALGTTGPVQIGGTPNLTINPSSTTSAVAVFSGGSKGIIFPNNTASGINGITSPATYLLMYQNDGRIGMRHFINSTWLPLHLGPTIAPASISAHQNNYTPSNFAESSQIKLSSTGELWAINGMAYAGPATPNIEDRKTLINNGSLAIYFNSEHPSSTAAYRFNHDGPYVLLPGRSVDIRYDAVQNRWKFISNESSLINAAIKSGVYYQYMASSITDGELDALNQSTSSGTISTSAPTANIPLPALVLSTSTSSTGAASVYFAKGVTDIGRIGSGLIFARAQVAFPALSTGVQTYTWGLSIMDDCTQLNFINTNEMGVKYSSGLNSGKFLGYTRNSSGTESTVDLGTTVAANTVYDVSVFIDDSVSEILFFINGAYSGRLTTNLPASGTNVGVRNVILKSAGTTATTCHLSRFEAGVVLP